MPIPIPFVLFEDMIADWFKDMQIYVDNLSPVPDADNSMFPLIGIPYHFDTTVLVSATVSNFTNYTDSDHGYGYQNIGFSHRLTLINGDLRCTNLQLQGKIATGNPGTWSKLTEAEQADALEKAQQLLQVGVHNNYPDSKIGFSTYSLGSFGFTVIGHSTTDMHYKYTDKDGEHINALYTCSASKTNNEITDNGDGTISGPFSGITLGGRNFTKTTPTIVLFSSDTNAQDFVSRMQSTNRDVYNHVCLSGATYKIYVGETYLVYVIDPTKVYTFYDLYDGTKTAAQQINDWTPGSPVINVPTYNDVKYGPEPEPVTDDDYVDMGLGVETDGMAMYNMAVITRDDLIQLIIDFESNADTGLSFIPHVLGLYKLGFESSQLLTTITDKIRLHKEPDGVSAFTSADDYNIVDEQSISIDCGSITVDREELLTNTFLDFSPYTTYEMFIPGCGWITLPDTIVGRTISVTIVFDLTTCSCKGVVRSEGALPGGSGTTLATVNGIIGSSVPLSINESGLQRAAIMNGSTQAAMALGTAFMGAGIGNPYMGASGAAMAASALASNHIAGNSTYTSTKGGATDYSVFGDGWKAVLKITRPVLEIPDNYGHSVGFVVNRYAQLSEFSGFTVCVNPHIHITATSDEKEEIKRLLEEGVILPEGE